MTRINQSTVRRAFQLTAALLLTSISAAQTTPASRALNQIRQLPTTAEPVKVPTDVGMGIDNQPATCCPAVMRGPFSQYFRYHQLAGKNISQSYGLQFLTTFVYPTAPIDTIAQTLTLDQQMMPFAYWIGSPGAGFLSPNSTPNSVLLLAEIREVLPSGATSVPTANDWTSYGSTHLTSAGPHAVRAWWAGGPGPSNNPNNVWDGSNTGTFHDAYIDGSSLLANNPLLPNHTYMIKMSLVFAQATNGVWNTKAFTCGKMPTFWWRVENGNLKTSGTPGQTQIQFNEVK